MYEEEKVCIELSPADLALVRELVHARIMEARRMGDAIDNYRLKRILPQLFEQLHLEVNLDVARPITVKEAREAIETRDPQELKVP